MSGYGLTTWAGSTGLTAANFQAYPDSIAWRHQRIPYPFRLDGSRIEYSGGIGRIVGYLPVNPNKYPGYSGKGAHFGQFRLNFPDGLFEELLFCRIQIATTVTRIITATIKDESAGGVTVFVWDSGGTPISGFSLWVRAIGTLKEGVLP